MIYFDIFAIETSEISISISGTSQKAPGIAFKNREVKKCREIQVLKKLNA